MKFRVLGCGGGIGGVARHTTSFMVDEDILIDSGTGVIELTLYELAAIDHIFITHAHLDHIAALPLIFDSVFEIRAEMKKPVVIYSQAETIEALKNHIFNWTIWPDFSALPDKVHPVMRFEVIDQYQSVMIKGRVITALPANHTVPALAYECFDGGKRLVFSGDTGPNSDRLWEAINTLDCLDFLLIENAFPNRHKELAKLSMHLCPDLLLEELKQLKHDPKIYITHLKPGDSDITMRQTRLQLHGRDVNMLVSGMIFSL